MLEKMLFQTVWGRGILFVFAAGVLSRMITVLSYKRMKKAAENPGKTKQSWVLFLKKRYESYERFGRIRDVEAFAAHYFARKGIWGLPLSFWDKTSAVFAAASGVLTMAGAARMLSSGQEAKTIFAWLFLGGTVVSGLIFVHIAGDCTHMKTQILSALTDYLANGSFKRNLQEESTKKDRLPTKEEVEALDEAAVTEEEKMVLEEVLEDYFW